MFFTENPKASRKLSNFRKPYQDAHQEIAAFWKGKPAQPQKYTQAVRTEPKSCLEAKKLMRIWWIFVLEIFLTIKDL